MKYGNRSRWKRFLASPVTMLVLAILALILTRGTWNLHKKVAVSSARLAQAEEQLNTLKERQNAVSDKVGRLSTDEGIEAEIRTKFHAVKAGESVAVIIDDALTANAKNSFDMATSTPGWWGRLLGLFGIGK